MKKLLELGACVDVRDLYGRTLLHEASSVGCWSAVVQLIKHGADVNQRDVDKKTPLRFACKPGYESIVKELLASEAYSDV